MCSAGCNVNGWYEVHYDSADYQSKQSFNKEIQMPQENTEKGNM